MVKRGTQSKKSRAKHRCPAELQDLINEANLVPAGIYTPIFDVEFRMEVERLKEEQGVPSPEISAYEFLKKKISFLPKEFLDYIGELAYREAYPFGENNYLADDRKYRQEFVRQYVEYCERRDSMLWLVQRIATEQQMMRDVETSRGLNGRLTFQYFTLLDWDAFPISIKTQLKRDDSGNLHITGLASLIGKFDDSRLRRCQVCQRIYWAKRENSKTCSPRCLNVFNVRKSRSLTDEEKAEIKAKREANRNLVKSGIAKSMKRRK